MSASYPLYRLPPSDVTAVTSGPARCPRQDETAAAELLADFYRAGDGNDEAFTAQMTVSQNDIAPPDIEGIQNVWIQGVGCGSATVHFSR